MLADYYASPRRDDFRRPKLGPNFMRPKVGPNFRRAIVVKIAAKICQFTRFVSELTEVK